MVCAAEASPPVIAMAQLWSGGRGALRHERLIAPLPALSRQRLMLLLWALGIGSWLLVLECARWLVRACERVGVYCGWIG
jgi:hypothetical protein